PRLRHAVVAPGRVEHRLEDRAGGLLIKKRHAVRVADDARQLVVVTVRLLALGERDGLLFLVGLRLLGPGATGARRLDHEGIASVHGGRAADGRVEVALDLLVEAREDRLLADRREAVRGRRHDLRRLDRLVEIFGGLTEHVSRAGARRQARGLADLLGQVGRHATEIAGQKSREPVALRVLQHLEQHAERAAVGMRLDLARRLRHLVVRPGQDLRLPLGRQVRELDVRVRDDRLLEILVDRRAALLVPALDLEGDLGAARRLPLDLLLLEDQGLVLLGVHLDLEEVRGRFCARARDDLHGLARRELAVHAGGRDTDALLTAAHAEPVELRSVEELREDRRDLLPDDARAVVGDRDAGAAGLARRRPRAAGGGGLPLDDDVPGDPGLLARVERVVGGFLDAGQKGLARIVEAEQMPVLREELRDGDLALARAHLDGRDGGLGRGRGYGLRYGRGSGLGCSGGGGFGATLLTTGLGQWRS